MHVSMDGLPLGLGCVKGLMRSHAIVATCLKGFHVNETRDLFLKIMLFTCVAILDDIFSISSCIPLQRRERMHLTYVKCCVCIYRMQPVFLVLNVL